LLDAALFDHLPDISRRGVKSFAYFVDRQATASGFCTQCGQREAELIRGVFQGYGILISQAGLIRRLDGHVLNPLFMPNRCRVIISLL
jgi:hypothetical protein